MAKDDLNPRDGIIRPAFYQPQQQGVTTAGQEIILENAGLIQQFVAKQRDQVRLGNLDQQRTTFRMPGLDVEYVNNFGQEYVRLTPYPEGKPPEEIDIPLLKPVYPPPPHIPPIPEIPYPTLCMLVLYSTNKFAAIPMAQLYGQQPNFGPVYSAIDSSGSFMQPVMVGQYNFAGYNFIITDVDLSGNKLKSSTICTTLIFDAITLGEQVTPIAISPSGGSGGMPQDDATITIYNTACAVSYSKGVFEVTAKNVNTEQAQAVDMHGTLYYGAEWNTNTLVGLTVLKSSIDTTVYQDQLATTTLQNSDFVPFYDVNYILYIDDEDTTSFKANVSLFHYQYGMDPDTGQPFNGTSRTGTLNSSDIATSQGTLVVTPYVIATDPGLGPQYQNLNNITEILGTSCYATSTYGQAMTITNMKQAYDDVPYYDWNQDALGYEYEQPTGHRQTDYSNMLPRMAFDFAGNSIFQLDNVSATGQGVQTVNTILKQTYPGWGGNFWTGVSGTSYQEPLSFDPNEIGASGQTSMQIVAHSTLVPTNYGQENADSPTPVPSYDQAVAWDQDVLRQMGIPTPGPNGANGPTRMFSSSGNNSTTQVTDVVNVKDQYDPYYTWYDVPGPPITTASYSSDIPDGPFYKAQTVTASYTFSLEWGNIGITGSDDGMGNTTQGAILALPFPPGTQAIPYALVAQLNSTGYQSTMFVTPYGNLPASSLSGSNPTGWMHVSDPNFVLQGFIIDAKPHIYLNSQDVTAQLAKALGCASTDIAACYFDIELDTIKLLGGIKVY